MLLFLGAAIICFQGLCQRTLLVAFVIWSILTTLHLGSTIASFEYEGLYGKYIQIHNAFLLTKDAHVDLAEECDIMRSSNYLSNFEFT